MKQALKKLLSKRISAVLFFVGVFIGTIFQFGVAFGQINSSNFKVIQTETVFRTADPSDTQNYINGIVTTPSEPSAQPPSGSGVAPVFSGLVVTDSNGDSVLGIGNSASDNSGRTLLYSVAPIYSEAAYNGAVISSSNYLSAGTPIGVAGRSSGSGGIGIYGDGASRGVIGQSTDGVGLFGASTNGLGIYGITGNTVGGAAIASQGPIVLKYPFVKWDGTEEIQDRIKISSTDSKNYITSFNGPLTLQSDGPVVVENPLSTLAGLWSYGTATENKFWGSKIDMSTSKIDLTDAEITGGGAAIAKVLAASFYRVQKTAKATSTSLSCEGDDLLIDCSAWDTVAGDSSFEGINIITSNGKDRCQAVFNQEANISVRLLCLDSAEPAHNESN